ncbi:MAG: DegT/DnrJ/EryC1/StrS family aminotransferase [Patescibacteria group bacterium]
MKKSTGFRVPLVKNALINNKQALQALSTFILKTDRLSMGNYCHAFELAFAKKQKRKYAILFNSGGSANLAMIQTLKNLGKLKNKDKVGFSSLTWSTNVMPIIQLGLEAIPVDCDPTTLNSMSKNAIKILEKEKCSAFFLTNALGFAGDIDIIEKECKKRGIIVLEDNCEALGTELNKGKTGNFGLASSFSFFVAHHMSTIEGGMVCTDNDNFAEMLKIVRANGWDRNISPERQIYWRNKFGIESDFQAKYTFYDLGYNLRPTEITGFLGLHQLKFLDKTTKIREKNFRRIYKVLKENGDFLPLNWKHIKIISAFAIPLICKNPKLREKYIRRFEKMGVEVRPMIAGNMQRQPFYKKYSSKNYNLPGADIIHYNGFYCGNCPDYTEEELKIIIGCIKK